MQEFQNFDDKMPSARSAGAKSPFIPKRPNLSRELKRLPPDLARRRPGAIGKDESTPTRLPESNSWLELKEQAVLAFESGLLPRSVDSRQKAITIALMGREVGLTPMQALCGIYVVNGMTAMRGSLMLRLIYERVGGARITFLTPPDMTSQECTVEMQRPNGKPQIFRYTLDEARNAGFMNKPIWQQHTSTMLRWAAIRTGARVVFADAIAGCYMEDELPHGNPNPDESSVPETPEVPIAAAAPASRQEAPPFPHVEMTPVPAELVGKVEPLEPRKLVKDLPSLRLVTEKQVHRLYAIAHQKSWTRQEVGLHIEKWFKKREARELNRIEYDRLCNHLLSTVPKSDGEPNSVA